MVKLFKCFRKPSGNISKSVRFNTTHSRSENNMEQEFYDKDAIHYVVLGCPHAGKTTLIKQLAGEDSELVLFGMIIE